MQYLVYNLDYQKKDSVVEVTLSSATNVRLMDTMNFDLYKNNQQHKFYGGYVTVSPYRMAIPKDGRWVVTIDVNPDPKFKHSVKVLPKKLPDAR